MDRAGRRSLLLYPTAFIVVLLAAITVALRLRVRKIFIISFVHSSCVLAKFYLNFYFKTTYYWMNFVSIACIIGHVSSYAVGLGTLVSSVLKYICQV